MHEDDDRYTRQRRLEEIGDDGQRRLFSASVTIGGASEGAGRENAPMVELVYLHRAGVGSVAVDSLAAPRPFAHAGVFRHEAARRHAAAAWRALRTLVELVGARAPGAPS